uniref:neutral cholesterol ester hydrolase 1-like n=1 Tax=Monopterus albus TaxID=43700 RepID=UPI0009B331F6|nr:neutral cholesterol ester hydrolase 1-like [Monopterus albus]
MLVDAVLRTLVHTSDMAHALGLSHRASLLNQLVSWADVIEAHSCSTVHVTDSVLGGVPTRVFQPKGGRKLKRGIIYFHGGGWALGSGRMRSYDRLCRKMAKDLDAVIMSVDYRLVPEVVFPDQYHDALAASRAFLSSQVLEHYSIDPERLYDGLMYARRLQDAGVTVTSDHYEDGFHACMVFAYTPMMSSVGQRSMNNFIRWLDQNL